MFLKPYFSVPFILKSDIFICCHTWRDMASNSISGAPSCQNIYRTNCSLSSSSSTQLNEINCTFHSKILILQNHSVKPNKFLHCKLTDFYFLECPTVFTVPIGIIKTEVKVIPTRHSTKMHIRLMHMIIVMTNHNRIILTCTMEICTLLVSKFNLSLTPT